MPRLLGEILVRAKAVTPRQLDDAISNQVIYGGRLGTNLLDLEYITEPVLANFLSVQWGTPTIAPQAYAKIHTAVAKLLPKAIAERTLTVPVVLKDKVLHVVMADPGNVEAQDEVRFATGYKLHVYVAPEVRVYYLLNKLYGTKRDARFVELSRPERQALAARAQAGGGAVAQAEAPVKVLSATGSTESTASGDTGDLMSEEEFTRLTQGVGMTEDMPPEQAAAVGDADGELLGDVADDEHELIVLDDEVVETEQPEEREEPLELVDEAASEAPAAPAAADSELDAFRKSEEVVVPPPRLTLAQATKALQHVEDRDQIARVALGFASGTFKRTALFVVRPGMVMGWDGYGGNITRDNIERLMIPLNAPSVFKLVVESRSHFLGPIPKTAVNNRFMKTIGGAAPRSAFLIPILFKGKVVNLLYGDNGPGTDATFDIGELLILGMKIPQSFEDLLRRTKAAVKPAE